jgi:tetratricopeptide (TPR) repeat protein
MKSKTRIAIGLVPLVLLCAVSASAQSANLQAGSGFDSDRPGVRLGVLWGAPTSVQDYVREINGYIERGETDKAEARVREALIETKNSPDLLVLAGHIFAKKRQFFLAEDYWGLLAQQFPSNAWAQACWGGMLLRVERWEKADDVLSAARRMDPKELVARYNLACSRLHSGGNVPLWMLDKLTTDEIGRIATWIGDEPDVLVGMLAEDGYRTLCRVVLTGETGVRKTSADNSELDLAALSHQMKDVARAIWQAHQAQQRQDWPAALKALQDAQTLGATAPAIQNDVGTCRSHMTSANQGIPENRPPLILN